MKINNKNESVNFFVYNTCERNLLKDFEGNSFKKVAKAEGEKDVGEPRS